MLFQKNLTRSGNALIFEHGEESVQGLVIGHCHHLLFLPAAGERRLEGIVGQANVLLAASSCNRHSADLAVRWAATDNLFYYQATAGAKGFSVRLASVVSEELTHPEMPHCFRHCLPPFVILSAAKNLFPRCWFSVHLLFLPAAGDFRSGTSWFAGDAIHSTIRVKVARFTHAECYADREWAVAHRCSVRLACVVSEDLTHAGKCQKMLFVILSAAKNLCCSIVSSVVFSVPSCCWFCAFCQWCVPRHCGDIFGLFPRGGWSPSHTCV